MDNKLLTGAVALLGIWLFLRNEPMIEGKGVGDGTGSGVGSGAGSGRVPTLQGNGFVFPDPSTPSSIGVEEARRIKKKQKLNYPIYFSFIPTEVMLGLIQNESSFRPRVLGNDLEIGLTQVKYSTWADMQKRYKTEMQFYGSNPSDYQHQIFVGMLYLYEVSRIIGTNDLASVLTGYNVGPNGFLQGRRNDAYVQRIFGHAGVFTPVPTASPASLPSNQSLIFGQNQVL